MRIIKFRGRLNNLWVYGNLQIVEPEEFKEYGDSAYIIEASSTTMVDINTIGQFTGLHDKNGKEIYEGDIMGLPENDANGVKYKNRYTRVVEWVNDGFFLLDYCTIGGEVRKYGDRLALEISLNSNYDGIARCFQKRGLDYTVIGNIHDNPELLKS